MRLAASLFMLAFALPLQAEEKVLNLYNWADYVPEEALKRFQRDTGIQVKYDTFDSAEVLDAKLLTGGSGYDVVFPASSGLGRAIQAKALQPVGVLGNAANLDPEMLAKLAQIDPDNRFGVPYTWGTVGLAINRQAVEQRLRQVPVAVDGTRRRVERLRGLIDGEAVGNTLQAFDLLEVKGTCLRKRRYIDRFTSLMMIIPPGHDALRWVSTSVDPNDKLETYEELRSTNCEGVVFKDMDAAYSPGRPSSGGPQLKFKFVESASFVVKGINTKRSVTLGLYDGDKLVPAGNVTIPPNHAIPQVGNVVDARYLYAYRESGSIYQPVYLGRRDDIQAAECVVEQLKYKSESATITNAAA